MRTAVLGLLLFLAASGALLWLPGRWQPGHEVLFLLHLGLGLLGAVPLCVWMARHMEDAAGRRVWAAALLGLCAVEVVWVLYYDWIPLIVFGKWAIAVGVLLAVLGARAGGAFILGTAAFFLLLHALSRWEPDLVLQSESFQLAAPLWIAVAAYVAWARGSVRPPLGAAPVQVMAGMPAWVRAAAVLSGGITGFLVATGVVLLLGGGIYREGRIVFVLHRWAGLLLLPLLAAHVARRAVSAARDGRAGPLLRRALPRWGTAMLVAAGVSGAAFAFAPRAAERQAGEPARSGSAGRGEGPPFAPSAGRTADGRPLPQWPAQDGGPGCGGSACHEAVTRQWHESAHRFSAHSPVFKKALHTAREELGAEGARFCAGCHAPVALLAGREPAETWPDGDGWRAGITCGVCHFARDVDDLQVPGGARGVPSGGGAVQPAGAAVGPAAGALPGNGSLVVAAPDPLILESVERLRQPGFLPPQRHSERYMPDVLRSPRLCEACHRQLVLPDLTGTDAAPVVLQDQGGSWRHGPFGPNGPSPMSCADCHMPRLEDNPFAFPVRDHRMPGGNWLLPRLRHDEEHERFVKDFLSGKHRQPPPEFDARTQLDRHPSNLRTSFGEAFRQARAALRHETPWRALREAARFAFVGRKPFEAVHEGMGGPTVGLTVEGVEGANGGTAARVRVISGRVGHRFPEGPQDLVEAWVEVEALAADDRVVAAGRAQLGGIPEDSDGQPIRAHRVWTARRERDLGRVPPQDSLELNLGLVAVAEIAGAGDGGGSRHPARLRARLLYRPMRPSMLAWATGWTEAEASDYVGSVVLAEAEAPGASAPAVAPAGPAR